MLSPSSKDSTLSSSTGNQNRLSAFSFGEKRVPLSKIESSHDPAEETAPHRCGKSSGNSGSNALNSPLSLSEEEQPPTVFKNLDGDQLSLESVPPSAIPSSPSQSRANASRSSASKQKDSLIFERFVQDQLIDSHPLPSSLPRLHSTENFVPASLDLTAQISHDELDQVDRSYPRRSSTASLQAAFATPTSRRLSFASTRPSTRGSTSNLTEQLLSSQPQRPTVTHSLTTSNLPPPETQGFNSPAASPVLKQNNSTLSFCSYADMISLEDQQSKFPIRRPSLSASISNNPRLSRTSSISSSSFLQRSPISVQPPQIHPSFGPPGSGQASTSSLSPAAGPISPQLFARGPLSHRASSVQSGKKFTVDTQSSDSDGEGEQSSIPQRFPAIQRKKVPAKLSSTSQTSFRSGGNNIDDLLVDNESDQDSFQSFVSEGLLLSITCSHEPAEHPFDIGIFIIHGAESHLKQSHFKTRSNFAQLDVVFSPHIKMLSDANEIVLVHKADQSWRLILHSWWEQMFQNLNNTATELGREVLEHDVRISF
ncbi:hypothetical protein OGAPHI_002241 [Ogataea philodendri]|uniref:Uncharacterized protein n=1 Tax=Ogataea philodendri TaxID=1378263 RepID=A0A9P8PBX8_9ASCO|nr:uncharacterized protein OGAPHI_002241 [Ogataea philodendri]KAH3668487.1 hypothetical protein OGAPHI_002241 [Ogataea philodendri]